MSPHSAKASTDRAPEQGPAIDPRPVSFADLLKASWRLYRRTALRTIPVSLVVFILALGMVVGLDYLFDDASDPLFIVAQLALQILFTVVASFAVATLIVILAEVVAGRRAESSEIRAVLRNSAREIVLAGLLSCAFLIVFDLLQLTRYFLLAALGPPFVIHALALEGRPFREAVSRARELLAGEWGRVLLSIVGVALVLLLVMFTIGLLVLASASSLGEDAFDVIAAAYLTLAPSLTLPFFVAATLTLYLDLCARKEGLSFQTFGSELKTSVNSVEEGPIQG